MKEPMNAAANKGLPSPAERPDLYDGFDGLQRESGRDNPVGVPSRLQVLIAERQAKAAPKRPITAKSAPESHPKTSALG